MLSCIWHLNPANRCNERWLFTCIFPEHLENLLLLLVVVCALAQLSHHKCATDLSILRHCRCSSQSCLSHSSVALAAASHGQQDEALADAAVHWENRGSQVNRDAASSSRFRFIAFHVSLLLPYYFSSRKNVFQAHVQRNLGNVLHLQILQFHRNSSHRCTLDKKQLWKKQCFLFVQKSCKYMSILWVSAYISRKMHAKVCAEETAL